MSSVVHSNLFGALTIPASETQPATASKSATVRRLFENRKAWDARFSDLRCLDVGGAYEIRNARVRYPAKEKSKTPRAKTARGAPKGGFNDQSGPPGRVGQLSSVAHLDYLNGQAYSLAMTLSARNRLEGEVVEIEFGGVMAHVVIRTGKNLIESVITKRSAEEMKLKVGDKVSAVIKSTEVMLEKG